MKKIKQHFLLYCLLCLSGFSTTGNAEVFVPIMVGDIAVVIPVYTDEEESPQSKVMPLGTDADRDGVRDDVQHKINAKFGKNTAVANYSMGMARSFQKVLSGALGHKQINQQVAQIEHLDACIQNKTNTKDAGLAFLLPEQLNTVARTRAYLRAAAEAYDAEGPPIVKPCGGGAKRATGKKIALGSSKAKGVAMARRSSKSSSKGSSAKLDDYDVIFINGVKNSNTEALEGAGKLKEVLSTKTVTLEYNKNHFLGQYFDLWVQKVGEIQVDKTGTFRFWLSVYYGIKPDHAIYQTLATWLDPNRDVGHWAEKDLKRMIQTAKTSLANNKKVLVIPHSEGNFFYRKIHQALNQWNTEKTQQCFAGVGIATPLSSKPGNYNYITSNNDKVINGARAIWGSTLPSNITIPSEYGEYLGHGLLTTYLSYKKSLQRFNMEVEQAVNQLDKNCKNNNCAKPIGRSGGQGRHKYTYALKDTFAHKVEISFEAFNIPDSIRITANDITIAKTDGLVSGFHQWQIDYDPKKHGTEFIAHVNAPNGETAWKLCIDCEGASCGDQIKRKNIFYGFHGDTFWECNNYKIDGFPVDKSGSIKLSIGNHAFSANCWCKSAVASRFCESFFGFPNVSVNWSSASCGDQRQCALNDKREVIVEVY